MGLYQRCIFNVSHRMNINCGRAFYSNCVLPTSEILLYGLYFNAPSFLECCVLDNESVNNFDLRTRCPLYCGTVECTVFNCMLPDLPVLTDEQIMRRQMMILALFVVQQHHGKLYQFACRNILEKNGDPSQGLDRNGNILSPQFYQSCTQI